MSLHNLQTIFNSLRVYIPESLLIHAKHILITGRVFVQIDQYTAHMRACLQAVRGTMFILNMLTDKKTEQLYRGSDCPVPGRLIT